MELRDKICSLVDAKADCFVDLNDRIWATPGAGLQGDQERSGADRGTEGRGLSGGGGPCRNPDRLVGSWGSGRPIIGILGEFDALPGLSQKAGCPVKDPVVEGGNGHGCGHWRAG